MPRERPPFSALTFRSGAYHFHKWQKYSAPKYHHFTFLPFRRPSFSKFLYVQAVYRRPRPAYCSQPERKAFGQRPWVSGRPECQPDASYSQFRRPPLSRSCPLRSPAFSRTSSVRSPHFLFVAAHTFQNLGWLPPAFNEYIMHTNMEWIVDRGNRRNISIKQWIFSCFFNMSVNVQESEKKSLGSL